MQKRVLTFCWPLTYLITCYIYWPQESGLAPGNMMSLWSQFGSLTFSLSKLCQINYIFLKSHTSAGPLIHWPGPGAKRVPALVLSPVYIFLFWNWSLRIRMHPIRTRPIYVSTFHLDNPFLYKLCTFFPFFFNNFTFVWWRFGKTLLKSFRFGTDLHY